MYVWIFQNGVEFEAKLFRLPRETFAVLEKAGGGGASVKEGSGRKSRGLATSCYHRGAPGSIPWGVGRVTESGLLLSESTCFLCRSALVRNALHS